MSTPVATVMHGHASCAACEWRYSGDDAVDMAGANYEETGHSTAAWEQVLVQYGDDKEALVHLQGAKW